MSTLILKILVCLAGVGGGFIALGISSFLLLFAVTFRVSGSDIGFTTGQLVLFTILLIGGVSGIIAGGMVFKWPGASAVAFSVATVLSIIVVIPLITFELGLGVPAVLFGVGTLLSWFVRQKVGRLNPK